MIYFIDFEDSFNLNIISYLEELSEVKIIHYRDLSIFIDEITDSDIAVLGPGPGHISEYAMMKGLIEKLAERRTFLFGVCLGHQLLLNTLFKCEILRSVEPKHGQQVVLDKDNTRVMRYNSWFVDHTNLKSQYYKLDHLGELCYYFDCDRLYTLQFHPESIGTSCPDLFFQPLKDFLRYASLDEQFDNLRNI